MVHFTGVKVPIRTYARKNTRGGGSTIESGAEYDYRLFVLEQLRC